MSLLCIETGRDIEYGDALYAATCVDSQVYSALCGACVRAIPDARKRHVPAGPDDGFDIHRATSSRNFTGSYTLCDFTLGEFLFSINRQTAGQYLPHTSGYFLHRS